MRSVLRSIKKRKKSRRLGEVEVISRDEYADFDVDSKVEMIRALVPLGLMHVAELLDDEVMELAGARHARKESTMGGRRHGSNPRNGSARWSARSDSGSARSQRLGWRDPPAFHTWRRRT